ncbi:MULTISPECIES: hypothetical protein [Aeromonas]|uniref:hypothetical protein n=1 Tax=Aeromonas TaxID=642 RepID=UPI00259DCB0D|nr:MULTISPECIES: hypothetical protein [Aeromonas]MDM5121025.1 hypothetical protein [Aeromonas hydrophila]
MTTATTVITVSNSMTLRDLADQYFGIDFEYIDRYTNFLEGMCIVNSPWILIDHILGFEIDMQKVTEWLVYYCEDLSGRTNFSFGRHYVALGQLDQPDTADAMGAILILGSLHNHISIQNGQFRFRTNMNTYEIKRKDAVDIAKMVLTNKLKEIYAEHPHFEFEKMMGITQEQRYLNLCS